MGLWENKYFNYRIIISENMIFFLNLGGNTFSTFLNVNNINLKNYFKNVCHFK